MPAPKLLHNNQATFMPASQDLTWFFLQICLHQICQAQNIPRYEEAIQYQACIEALQF